MKSGMTLDGLLHEVSRQAEARRDYVATTDEAFRLVEMNGYPDDVALVVLKENSEELERFRISEHCHKQIADKLQIPWRYYHRLLSDHRDMVIDHANKLFEREPSRRLLRTMDGVARGFLSDHYKRIDNDRLLGAVLPTIVKSDLETRLLSSNVGSDGSLSLKLLFTDDRLAVDLGPTARGDSTDVVRPGFRMKNDEVGRGKSRLSGFFYRSYCTNGCVFGTEQAFDFSRTHLGGRLIEGVDYAVISDETRRLDDETITSAMTDVMRALGDVEFHQKLAERLRAAKASAQIEHPVDAVSHLAREVGLTEREGKRALENLLRDGDLSKWGAVNAVTAIANDEDTSYERANELEDVGAQILSMGLRQWSEVAAYLEAA